MRTGKLLSFDFEEDLVGTWTGAGGGPSSPEVLRTTCVENLLANLADSGEVSYLSYDVRRLVHNA